MALAISITSVIALRNVTDCVLVIVFVLGLTCDLPNVTDCVLVIAFTFLPIALTTVTFWVCVSVIVLRKTVICYVYRQRPFKCSFLLGAHSLNHIEVENRGFIGDAPSSKECHRKTPRRHISYKNKIFVST